MSMILDEYDKVYQKLKSYSSQIDNTTEEIERLRASSENSVAIRIEKIQKLLIQVDDAVKKIEYYKSIAELNLSSKNLLTIEITDNYRVNTTMLDNWVKKIDNKVQDDPYAQRVFRVSCCDLLFLDRKKAEYNKMIAELEKERNIELTKAIIELEKKLDDLFMKCNSYIESDEFNNFAKSVCEINKKYRYIEIPYTFTAKSVEPDAWVPGIYTLPLNVGKPFVQKIKEKLGENYNDQSGIVFIPIDSLNSLNEFALSVLCTPMLDKAAQMEAGIRNFVLNMIDNSPVGSRKIYVIDSVNKNSSFICTLKSLEESFVLHPVPESKEEIEITLKEVIALLDEIDNKLGSYKSVIEYNKNAEAKDKIMKVTLVLVGWPDYFDRTTKGYIERIIANYERYGVSFIFIKITDDTNVQKSLGLPHNISEKLVNIKMTSDKSLISCEKNVQREFKWHTFKKTLSDEYCNAIKEIYANAGLITIDTGGKNETEE